LHHAGIETLLESDYGFIGAESKRASWGGFSFTLGADGCTVDDLKR